MSLLDRDPVFIVGAQRSGTTWVQRMLCAHPQIVGGQESHLFDGYLAPLWKRWQFEQDSRASGSRTIGLGCYLTEDEFIEESRALARRVFARLEDAKPGATLLVEKTPDHALHLPLIRRLFPDAVILHVLRDGRDVVASLVHAHKQPWGHWWTPATAEEAAQRWVEWVRTIQRDANAFARHRTVRYEELVRDGPAALASLFEFLGVPLPCEEVEAIHDRCRFDSASHGAATETLILEGQCRNTVAGEPRGFFRQGSAGGWEQDLSSPEQGAVHAVAGPLLRELGYPLPPSVQLNDFVLSIEGDKPSVSNPPVAPVREDPWRFISTAPSEDILWTRPTRWDVIDATNAQLLHRERLYLFATVLALAPERCLEIGVAQGGSTRIIHAALADLGRGRLVSVDPAPSLSEDLRLLAGRVKFLVGPSPASLERARELAGGDFDFVLLDGDHSRGGVFSDLAGLGGVTHPGTVILAHDTYFTEVAAGIADALQAGLPFLDAGIVSTTRHPGTQGGHPVEYAGFRLLIRREEREPSRPSPLARLLPHRVARKVLHLVRSKVGQFVKKD